MPGGPKQPVLGGVEHKIGAVAPIFSQVPPAQTEVDPPFIASVTQVYAPTAQLTSFNAPFIASVTVIYAPSVPEVNAPFISSVTVIYAPGVGTTGTTFTTPGTYTWVCPTGITEVDVWCIGGAGAGGTGQHLGLPFTDAAGGGGGGASARRIVVPVTPGNTYTIVVGGGGGSNGQGNAGGNGADSTFTGDSGVQVIAKGGHGGSGPTKGTGGAAGSSTGDVGHVFSGGDGGTGANSNPNTGGAGGGASGNDSGAGANGTDSIGGNTSGQAGGAGANGGGSGGSGGNSGSSGASGTAPGGGGGGGAWSSGFFGDSGPGAAGQVQITVRLPVGFISSVTQVYGPTVTAASNTIAPSFIASVTTLYAPELTTYVPLPFISSVTVVYAPDLPEIHAPFIASKTHVWNIFSSFDPNRTFGGPGNGGESFLIRLAPNGTSVTATLAVSIGAGGVSALALSGDSGMPSDKPFVVTIDNEVLLVFQIAPGSYQIRLRAVSNTTASSHTAGASVVWGDSYDMAIVNTQNLHTDFTADILGTGSSLYTGWLMAFDSTQAYKTDGSRFPLHVSELSGVFAAGAGTSGSSKVDGAQPSAIHTPEASSDHCGAGLTVPALITTNMVPGDVVVVKYTNPEAFALDLGPRSTAIQSWYGLKRVSTSDVDVTYTDPNGIVVDTKSGYATYTGSVNVAPDEPLAEVVGVAPDATDTTGVITPTPNPVPYLTTTLLGSDRYFTDGIHYSERGWPIGVLTVRQGNRRIPHWQSWDWHDFSYVYNGFGTDCSFAQVVINRNGMTGSLPIISLPGAQDIDGPEAVWDDGSYYFASSWYVALVATPYLVGGPIIGGGGGAAGGGANPTIPSVTFPGGGGGSPSVSPPGPIEGGSGGDIGQPPVGLHVWQKSGGF